MKVLAVSINKGGVGKTTVAKSVAVAATAQNLNVVLLDMDSQENSRKWGNRRKARNPYKILPIVNYTTETSLPDELERAKKSGCDLVVIDTPPGRSSEAVAAVEAADLVLIPIEADDQDSFDGLPRTVRLARSSDTPAISLLNKATPNSRGQVETARLVSAAAKVTMSPVVLHRYKEHRDANPKGLTAQELAPNSVAAAEINNLWSWLCAQMHISTNAPVQLIEPGRQDIQADPAPDANLALPSDTASDSD